MRIGVVSDTHNQLRNVRRIVELFNRAGVDRVVHTGDITQAKTLEVFSNLRVPMFGVFGNNDVERDALATAMQRHGFAFFEPPLSLTWEGRELVVVHDPRELETVKGAPRVALHGHTHRLHLEDDGTRLTFNPGESAGHMQGHNAVGVVDLETLHTELLRF